MTPEVAALTVVLVLGLAFVIHGFASRWWPRVETSSPSETADGSILEEEVLEEIGLQVEAKTTGETTFESFLAELDHEIGLAEQIQPALANAAAIIKQRFDSPAVAIWTQSQDDPGSAEDRSFYPVCGEGELLDLNREEKATLAELFGPWAAALADNETVCIPDPASEPDLCGKVRLHAGSLVLAPYRLTATTNGILAVAWHRPSAVTGEEMRQVRETAEALGRAVERLALSEELRYRRAEAGVLLEVTKALIHAPDLAATLRSIMAAVHDGLGYNNCAVLLLDSQEQNLYVASQVGYRESIDSLRLPLDGPSVTATAARTRETQIVADVSQWPGYVPGDDSITSEIAIPLIVDNEVLGVLDIESQEVSAFDGTSQAILDAVASEAAMILAHSRVLSGLDDRASQLQAVDRLARAMTGTIDPREILKNVVEEVRASIACDWTAVLRFYEGGSVARIEASSGVRQGASSDPIEFKFEKDARRILEEIGDSGCFCPDTALEEGEFAAGLAARSLHSAFAVPIEKDGEIAAVFVAASRNPFAFSDSHLAGLEAMSPHIAAGVRNAYLYEELHLSYHKLNEAQGELVRTEQFRVLGEMTSGLAHKFNNLLGAILGRVQIARRRTDNPELLADLEVVERSAQEGATTIRQLQQFTGVHAVREFTSVNLSEAVERVLDRCPKPWKLVRTEKSAPDADTGDGTNATAGEKKESKKSVETGYRIVADLSPDAWVEGHEQELEEVVSHAVVNAIEAMAGGGELSVRTWNEGSQVLMEVSDNGPGMSDEARSRIFHPFFTTKGPRSLGLGLSIGFGIVQRHGGSLEVDSQQGRGTTVRLNLPAKTPSESEGRDAGKESPTTTEATILVVEDEPAVADLLGEILTSAGHKPVVINSAPDAVEKLAHRQFDVVLTDLGLPQMSGWELARHCRDLHPGVPVVLVTGWGLEVEGTLISESEVFDVIAKPFTVEQILDAVDRALDRGARAPEAA